MKNQALYSSKDEGKTFKSRLPLFLFGALRVKSRPLLMVSVFFFFFFFFVLRGPETENHKS